MVRALIVGLSSALVAGVLIGVVSRILMRAATVAVGGEPHFSWGGSLFIVLLYAAAMVPGGLLAATGHRYRWLSAAGVLFLFVPATGIASEELTNLDRLSTLRLCLVGVLGLSIYASLVVLPFVTVLVLRRLERIFGSPRRFPDPAPVGMQR